MEFDPVLKQLVDGMVENMNRKRKDELNGFCMIFGESDLFLTTVPLAKDIPQLIANVDNLPIEPKFIQVLHVLLGDLLTNKSELVIDRNALARKCRCSVFTVLRTYEVLEDLCILTSLPNRSQQEIVNTIVVNLKLIDRYSKYVKLNVGIGVQKPKSGII